MAYEPRPVPQVEEPILQSYWYCLDCGYRNAMRSEVFGHWKKAHAEGLDEIPVEGIDMVRGDQLVSMTLRREAYIEQQAEELRRELEPLQTAEDVIAEMEIHGA